jgi:Mrp family chromosome partitioning ATPase
MTWAVLVTNSKGGTGKSTIAVALAENLRDKDHDVGLLDADIDSANLASRLGCEEKISFSGDHVIEPVDHEGMKLYSMENAFDESTFAQSGDFMGTVIDNMVNHSNWGDLDYMVVDCPPGSSDVFSELVRSLRPSIKGAISVGISDAVEDTARLVKVCNHNWVPILGFVENMHGIHAYGQQVTVNDMGEQKAVYPFGKDRIEKFADNVNGNFLGNIPLCCHGSTIENVAGETIDNAVEAIKEAPAPELPDDNLGNTSFIRNVWSTIQQGISKMNEEYNVEGIQDQFGVEDRDPLIMSLKLTDAGPISQVLDEVIITVDAGDIKVMRPKSAKRKGIEVEGGMEISSQDLHDAVAGEKKVMRAVTGEVATEPYSITKAVQMGDAEIWGDRTINRLAVLDRILSEVIDMEDVREVVQ